MKSRRAPFVWTAYILLPAAGWGLLHGLPIGLLGACLLFAVWWSWHFGGLLPGRWLVLALLPIKLAAGTFLLVDRGLQADYFANNQWTPPVEHSTEFPRRGFTRVDRRLSFGGEGAPDFPLYFFNDAARFNFYQPGDPGRSSLPFSSSWQGYVPVRQAEDRRTFYLKGKRITAELWVDGVQSVRLEPAGEEAVERAPWPSGLRHLTIRMSSTYGGGRQFEAGFVDANGTKTPFDQTAVLARPPAPWRIVADRVVRAVSRFVDELLMAILVCCLAVTVFSAYVRIRSQSRDEALLAFGWLAAMIGGVLFARSSAGHLILLQGGQDFLNYEHYAREVALHGLFRLSGVYPYFLALTHLVLGEDLSGIYLVQWLLAVVTVIAVWKISAKLFDAKIGSAALVLAMIYFFVKLVPLAGVLAPENLYLPLLVVWALLLIEMGTPASTTKTAVLAGVVGGLATLARSTLLAGWILALPVLASARRRARLSRRAVALMLIVMIAVVSLALPAVMIRPGSEFLSMLSQYAHGAPGYSARNLINNALYALGFFDRLVPNAGTADGLIVTWCMALVGIGVMMFGRDRLDRGEGPPRLAESPGGAARGVGALPALLSLSHLIVVAVFFPHVFGERGDRLILPSYILLLPYAALGMMTAVDFLVPPEEQ